ncbi:hypothetical protein [Bacillus sp. AG4(2022)]|uniref:hypothetical protein n=1 Tax=Bacillus sp. AG4(2022) TaxID=2962594 RepID=UPI0028822C70|nr:hypothetical protein [Bacillus sp. AG4(2022)]MDT0160669.1 hypothetical protein [Bacillus sp. AG4(2022)]
MVSRALVDQPNISKNSIIGHAILAVNINSNNSTFIDYFLPMVSETIRVSPNEYITIEDINNDLIKSFGIRIPLNVIRTILNKLKRKKYINYNAPSKSYTPNRRLLEKSNFKEKQIEILGYHQQLILELKDFLLSNSVEVNLDEAEKYFEEFLEETGYSLSYEEPFDFSESDVIRKRRLFLVSKFIKKIEEDYSPTFNYYESIVMGNMLANAMYYTEPDKFQQKFTHTIVYLDAPLIIFALGYAGKLREEPCNELIKMLRQNHAVIKCFQHSVDEIRDILYGCISKLENGQSDNFGTIEYFLSQQYDKANILSLINSLEREIKERLRIGIVEKPEFKEAQYDFNIDEKNFTDYLRENMRYKFMGSLDRDVDSVHAVIRIRKGHKSISVENSKAIFITNNARLSAKTRRYFKGVYNGTYIPPILTDYDLTTLLWVKNPNVDPSLPRKRIIADCFASMQPPEQLVNKYLEEIKKLKETGKLSEGDYSLLKVSQESRQILMDETQGDEEVLTNAKVFEIVELTKRKMLKDKDLEIESRDYELAEKEKEIKKYKDEREQKLFEEKGKEQRQWMKVRRISSLIHMGLAVIVSILFCLGQLFIIKSNDINVPLSVQYLMYSLFVFLFPAMSFWGVGFISPLKKSKEALAGRLKKKFYDV